MNTPELDFSERFGRDIAFAVACVLIVLIFVAGNNFFTSDEPVEVGYVEVETYCEGINAGGFCLGLERKTHTTYNYDNYTEAEEGTEDFYRKVEAELMAQAYNICSEEIQRMEWASEAEYRGKTGDEWLENENVELLPCEDTTWRHLEAAG